jgi:CheY-like chemotaxis protein
MNSLPPWRRPPDWTETALGDPAHWPASLRLTVDILLNSLQAMLLMWGEQPVMVYNEAYAALVGRQRCARPAARCRRCAGGVELAAGRAGAGPCRPQRQLPQRACRYGDGRMEQQALDLYYTPVHEQVAWPASSAPGAARPAVAAGNDAPLRLLVVEDNPDARYLVCETLRALGHTVEATATGEEALPLLAGQPYDVLFTDVSLPGMSGVELARAAGASSRGWRCCLPPAMATSSRVVSNSRALAAKTLRHRTAASRAGPDRRRHARCLSGDARQSNVRSRRTGWR